jgi:hypothetical protein
MLDAHCSDEERGLQISDATCCFCCAVFPPPPMARLQPMPASHELLAPFDVAIRALRPNWAKPDPEMRKEVLRLGWKVLEETGRCYFP